MVRGARDTVAVKETLKLKVGIQVRRVECTYEE